MADVRTRVLKFAGFTLIEVLVALGIVAVALAAGMRSSAALTSNADRQSSQLLAQICAENALIAVRLAKQMPAVGESTSTCDQAGRSFAVKLSAMATPNPNFLRVQAQVLDSNTPVLLLSTIVGRF